MRPKSFIFGFVAMFCMATTLTFTSCSNNGVETEEELQQFEQAEPLSIDKDEIKEEDT